MSVPTISVIIPAYNAAKTILETIQSIQQQTCSDFELIVINDGSTDNTLDVLATVADPRLKVFSYENGGLPVARNRGIERATGNYLTFIDADDLWTPDKLEAQLEALQHHPDTGAVYSWTAFIDENSQFLYAWKPLYFQGNVYPNLLIENFISSGSNIMVRRQYIDLAGRFDPTLKSAEDWDYYLRLAALCPFALVPKYQILYRRSAQSMTSKVDVMEKNCLRVLERAFQVAPADYQQLKGQSLAHAYRFYAMLCIAHVTSRDGVRQATQKLLNAIRFYPKTLLDRTTQRLLLKLILLNLVPYQLATQLSRQFGHWFPAPESKPVSITHPDHSVQVALTDSPTPP